MDLEHLGLHGCFDVLNHLMDQLMWLLASIIVVLIDPTSCTGNLPSLLHQKNITHHTPTKATKT